MRTLTSQTCTQLHFNRGRRLSMRIGRHSLHGRAPPKTRNEQTPRRCQALGAAALFSDIPDRLMPRFLPPIALPRAVCIWRSDSSASFRILNSSAGSYCSIAARISVRRTWRCIASNSTEISPKFIDTLSVVFVGLVGSQKPIWSSLTVSR